MIVLVGGEKGGTGKSTLATNLCAWLAGRGEDVLLIDADRQGTAANWVAERNDAGTLPAVHCMQRYGNLVAQIRDVAKRYRQVVIDAGGRDSPELRSAMVAADLCLSPMRASQSDLWTVEHVDTLVAMARGLNPYLVALAVLTMAPTNPRVREAEEASQMLAGASELGMSASVIRDRKVYRDAMCEGRGVCEATDGKARAELEHLCGEVYDAEIQEQTRNAG